MNILLTAINSRYNHTNLALRSITEYIKKHNKCFDSSVIDFHEWTIAHFAQDIIRGIVSFNSQVVIFSVYIWNTRLVFDVIKELRKVAPSLTIGLGGPDVSYRAQEVLLTNAEVDFILQGEGEQTVLELVENFEKIDKKKYDRDTFLTSLSSVQGVYTRTVEGKILYAGARSPLNMESLAFPYTDFSEPDYKLFYYESSRGCPFSCSYCLSSIEKNVRFMPLDRVFADLQKFLDARVKIVKFVDRTFNLNTERYIAIWKFIEEHHNDYTMFHFEISAEHLDTEALEYLQTVKKGIMQFEIGVQSTNEATLNEINRPVNLQILKSKIEKIPPTIHSHLDLIAGLPHESLKEFEKSFNYTLHLKPDMLQLGFLKILSGTQMETYAKEHNYEWLSYPPHEVLQSPWMSYEDICFLHDLETVLDWYYNSHYFSNTITYLLEKVDNAFALFSSISHYFRKKGLFDIQHKTLSLFSFFHEYIEIFYTDLSQVLHELLRYDYFYMGKTSVYPDCFILNYDKDIHHAALLKHTDMRSTREAYTNSSFEIFSINPFTYEHITTKVLFLYGKRSEKKQDTVAIIIDEA